MAKGDHTRVQNAIDSNYGPAQTQTQQLSQQTGERTNQILSPAYYSSAGMNLNDYNDVMNNYRSFLGMGAAAPVTQSTTDPSGSMRASEGRSGGYTGGQQWNEQTFTQQFGRPSTPQQLEALEPQLNAAGIKIQRSADGTAGKILLPSGESVDVIQGSHEGGKGFQWLGADAAGGGGGASGPLGGYGALGPAIAGLMGFSQTGGFSPQDIQNIRARAEAPIRSEYSQAQDELQRQKNLSGGYAPNAPAAAAKMAREQAYATSDAETNANAAIAQMIQQGKLYGLTGLSNIGLQGVGQGLGAMNQMGSLYGTTPGLTNMFGNQVLGSNAQGINAQQLANSLAQNRVNAQLGLSSVPGNFQSAMGNIGSALGLGGAAVNMFNPLASLFGGGGVGGFGSVGTPGYPGDPYSPVNNPLG